MHSLKVNFFTGYNFTGVRISRFPIHFCIGLYCSAGDNGHPQAWARGGHVPPFWKWCEVFLCIAKFSVDELFMHYFHNLSLASAALPQIPTRVTALNTGGKLSFPDP